MASEAKRFLQEQFDRLNLDDELAAMITEGIVNMPEDQAQKTAEELKSTLDELPTLVAHLEHVFMHRALSEEAEK